MIDPSPTSYWAKALPEINERIQALPCTEKITILVGKKMSEKVCKKCDRSLPSGYKHKQCESCRNTKVAKVK